MSDNECHMCKEPAEHECANCGEKICADIDCGTDTVDGYLCGTYTQWGCAKKYTTCDICLDDKAIHESDLVFCEECGNGMCDDCAKKECEKCSSSFCEECFADHEC
jgi:hypothetical protein